MHEQDGDGEPAHHARRPMNAFLIFCKRHRSVVRDKYPNLENRSITKILGEWWANLEKEEKACYTDLAKQYKDAFFSANPGFKWYKLPAPPLRTLSARPLYCREPADKPDSPHSDHDSELEKTNNNSTKYDYNKKPSDDEAEADPKPMSMFTPGKLADEAQMGGLSSLLATKTDVQTPNPYYSPHTYKFTAISTPSEHRSHNLAQPKPNNDHSISELQNALSETTKMFEEEFDEPQYNYSDQFTNQDVIDQIVDKRYSNDEGYQRTWSDEERNRSGRSCKGKRYQEFMAVGGLIVNKRQRRDCPERLSDEGYSASCSCDPGSSREESTVTDDSKYSYVETCAEIEPKLDRIDAPEPDNNSSKTFKAADFDLDAKIRALPSLSLEKFQQRKRENKRKKKTVHSVKQKMPEQIINSVPRLVTDERRDMAESWRETVIGSQKRKPRKISITRLEINSMISSTDMKGHKISPEIKIATEAPCTMVHTDMCNSSVDMLALATLAEVASNTSRIEDTTAKASDASTV